MMAIILSSREPAAGRTLEFVVHKLPSSPAQKFDQAQGKIMEQPA